jgi:hypothetical protein
MITLKDIDRFEDFIATTVERGCNNEGQCFCNGKCHEIVGHIKNGKFVPNGNMNKDLMPARARNMWGADIEDCNEFSKRITKNAGQRDI